MHPACMAKVKTRKVKGEDRVKILRGIGICNDNKIREGMVRTCEEEHRLQMEALRIQQQSIQ